jgi:hypothetical protein
MKKFFFFSPVFIFPMLLLSCSNNTQNSSPADMGKMEVWARDIRSNSDILNEEEIDSTDWINYYVKSVDNKKIYETIMNAVKSGKCKAYADISDESSVMTIDEINSKLNVYDTVIVENKETGKFDQKIVHTLFNETSFGNLRMKEDWYFDPEKFTLVKKVTAICLVQKVYDEEGQFRGMSPFFWVKLNN